MPKKKWIAVSAFGVALVLGALALVSANRQASQPVTDITFVMDTVVEYKLYGKQASQAKDAIEQELHEIEERMSMYQEGSEISELNRQAGEAFVPLSSDTYELLSRSLEYAGQSEGVFDITIAPLTSSWGITSENPQIPEQTQIDALLELVDYREVILNPEEHSARLARKGQALDLGGIAKGYACDAARRIAEEYGISSGYISIGGNVMVIGDKPDGTPYKFGIRDPRGSANEYFGIVTIPNLTMATSGDYERFFEQDGVRYHHILDPRTGYPAQGGLMSVSVITPDGTYADFMSTWLFIMGKEFALSHLNDYDCGLIVVDQENNVYLSDNLKEIFVPADQSGVYRFEVQP